MVRVCVCVVSDILNEMEEDQNVAAERRKRFKIKELGRIFFHCVDHLHRFRQNDSAFYYIWYQRYEKRFDAKHFYSDVRCFLAWRGVKCISLLSVAAEEGLYFKYQHCQSFCIHFLHYRFYDNRRFILYLALYFLVELIRNTIFNSCIFI